VIGSAMKVMRIATGEEEEILPKAQRRCREGGKGGNARAAAKSRRARRNDFDRFLARSRASMRMTCWRSSGGKVPIARLKQHRADPNVVDADRLEDGHWD
jgi:hypothetical protein